MSRVPNEVVACVLAYVRHMEPVQESIATLLSVARASKIFNKLARDALGYDPTRIMSSHAPRTAATRLLNSRSSHRGAHVYSQRIHALEHIYDVSYRLHCVAQRASAPSAAALWTWVERVLNSCTSLHSIGVGTDRAWATILRRFPGLRALRVDRQPDGQAPWPFLASLTPLFARLTRLTLHDYDFAAPGISQRPATLRRLELVRCNLPAAAWPAFASFASGVEELRFVNLQLERRHSQPGIQPQPPQPPPLPAVTGVLSLEVVGMTPWAYLEAVARAGFASGVSRLRRLAVADLWFDAHDIARACTAAGRMVELDFSGAWWVQTPSPRRDAIVSTALAEFVRPGSILQVHLGAVPSETVEAWLPRTAATCGALGVDLRWRPTDAAVDSWGDDHLWGPSLI